MDYEPVKPPRFEIEQGLGGERIRVPPRRNVLILLFLPFWLFLWTMGGIAALGHFLQTFDPFIGAWLCAWSVAWLFAAAAIAWTIWGAELIGVSGGDLEIGHSLLGWTRSRRYRGRDIGHLSAADAPFFSRFQFTVPFVMRTRTAAIKFSYGGRTVYAAQGLDEAEGRMIVERLLRHLPNDAGTARPTERVNRPRSDPLRFSVRSAAAGAPWRRRTRRR